VPDLRPAVARITSAMHLQLNDGAVGAVVFAVSAVGLLSGCRREERAFSGNPRETPGAAPISMSSVAPSGKSPDPGRGVGDEENAYALSEGKRLYTQFNCAGCHAHGGGDIGPPLADAKWIYGATPAQIFASIVEGRPNGMPSFRGYIADSQVWQLTAYLRSMGGLTSRTAAPNRNDEMQIGIPENSREKQIPTQSSPPGGAQSH
jgi:cytochrome c oxidase cbb3-type subunit 3